MSRRAKYQRHPLLSLFDNKRIPYPYVEGMNALQEGPLRLISDNCVNVEDVALCDALECQYLAYPFSRPKP